MKRVAKKARKRAGEACGEEGAQAPGEARGEEGAQAPGEARGEEGAQGHGQARAERGVETEGRRAATGVPKASSSRSASPRRFPKAPAGAARTSSRKFSLKRLASRLAPQVRPPIEAYRGSKPYAFASYSHKNMKEVFGVIKKLADARFRIWYDEGIEPGNEWPEEVGKALTGCELFLVFMSPCGNGFPKRAQRDQLRLQ